MANFVDTAVTATRKAELVLSHYFLKRTQARRVGVEFKAQADKAADKVIYDILKKKFPTHSVLTEERAKSHSWNEYTWVVDPIDGTTNFICGFPLWAISIGLVKNGQPLVAVICIPELHKLYVAQKGKRTQCNGKPVRVSNITNLQQTVINLEPGYFFHRREFIATTTKKLGENISNIANINSVSAAFGLISSGNLQGLISPSVKVWELPPGMLIVEGAGGKATGFNGKKINFNLNDVEGYPVLASTTKLHSRLVKLLK